MDFEYYHRLLKRNFFHHYHVHYHWVALLSTYAACSLARSYILPVLRGFFRHFIRPARDLKKRYDGEWAAISGADTSIGRAYARQLSARGFNVVLIGTNLEILKALRMELAKEYGNHTKFLIHESVFSEDSLEKLQESLSQLSEDVCLYVNASAVQRPGYLIQQHMLLFLKELIAATQIAQHFIKKFAHREGRSGFINVSSMSVTLRQKNLQMFSASAAFMHQLVAGIDKDQSKKLDVLNVMAGNTYDDKSESIYLFTVKTDTHARACLNQLGYDHESYGALAHGIHHYLRSCWLTSPIIKFINKRRLAKYVQS